MHIHKHVCSLYDSKTYLLLHLSATPPMTPNQAAMENFLNTQLHPADICSICTEHFSAEHQPVALPCKHIFGHECIKRWLFSGRGNTNACPTCRYICVPKSSSQVTFDVPSIWSALCSQQPERLHAFMTEVWSGTQVLWQRHPSGVFSVTDILDDAIIPALIATATRTSTPQDRSPDPMLDAYNLVAASWDSLGRPDTATGLAIPLARLARLTASAGAVLPRWLTTNPRANRLIWRANACLPITADVIDWSYIEEASKLKDDTYLPLLQLYTVLISQGIAHHAAPTPYPSKRHEVMNLVVKRCCSKIGVGWKGKPRAGFKNALVGVYEELRRYQLEKGKMSLRGHDGEEEVVRGMWALAGWGSGRDDEE
jgi:hypothetical protein